MNEHMKQYVSPSDYWRSREFLRSLRRENPRPSETWHVGVFDYWRWHWLENVVERAPHELRYWENAEGKMVSVLIQGDPGVCHPLMDSKIQTADLAHEMLSEAEKHLTTQMRDGRQVVFVWADVKDEFLNRILRERGYEMHESSHSTEHNAWQPLSSPPAPAHVPEGYVVRSMGDIDEHPARSLASWRAFHPGEADEGRDPTGAWYRNVQRAPLYRRDLDIVAVAENGDIVSFSTCYFDDVSRTGAFVLVGTAEAHQRKGLGKAVMTEALRRLHHLGAVGAYVSWYEAPEGALYESVGFTDQEIGQAWKKVV
ncbi:GNAT family N-acetyltransferase [Candidatus Bipolaricaulota bacterium]|nr:GNAT family N-acetyltransferase [Candidatus Bipolaricaulota bacterium]TFH10251.1 MAG: N-acetyltransferase [Candidatus Atribacteria bacterium]